MLLRLNCHVANLSASLEISLPYQAVYYYLLDNPVSGPLFVPTVIAALYPSNTISLSSKRVQKGIAYWDKQNNDVPAPNCVLKV